MVHSSKMIHKDEHTGKPSTLMTNVNKESVQKLIWENQKVIIDCSLTEVTLRKLLISH
jgi:hypothetical protein